MKKVLFWILKVLVLLMFFAAIGALTDFIFNTLMGVDILKNFWFRLILILSTYWIYSKTLEYRCDKFIYNLINKIFNNNLK
jgi:hypothetical protein